MEKSYNPQNLSIFLQLKFPKVLTFATSLFSYMFFSFVDKQFKSLHLFLFSTTQQKHNYNYLLLFFWLITAKVSHFNLMFTMKKGLRRCGKSCRLRWLNYLRPGVKKGKFTPQEEEAIINFHSVLGNRFITYFHVNFD